MDHEAGLWNMASDSMVQLPWFGFLKNQFTKLLGPSLGVNCMWTERNDHAPNSEYAGILKLCQLRECFLNKI